MTNICDIKSKQPLYTRKRAEDTLRAVLGVEEKPQPQHGEVDPGVIDPDHYKTDKMEAIEVIEAFFMDAPHLANTFKYMARCGKKDRPLQELKKARWYLDRYIWLMESGQVAD